MFKNSNFKRIFYFKLSFLLFLFFGIFGMAKNSLAADFFVSENGTGTGTTNCANATNANSWAWTGVTEGDTVWVCGTITTPYLRVKTAGSTLKFCTDADCGSGNAGSFAASYWNAQRGGVECSNVSNATIDCNGQSVVATDNGSPVYTNPAGTKGHQVDMYGIYANSCSNIVIKNCTVDNIYLRATGSDDPNAYGIGIKTNVSTNATVSNNVVRNAKYGIMISYSTTDMIGSEVSSNDISLVSTAIVVATNSGASTSNVTGDTKVHDNVIHDLNNWDGTWGRIPYSEISGTFLPGDTVTSAGFSATVLAVSASNHIIYFGSMSGTLPREWAQVTNGTATAYVGTRYRVPISSATNGPFSVGNTITAANGFSATISEVASSYLTVTSPTGDFPANGDTVTSESTTATIVQSATNGTYTSDWHHGDGIHLWGGDASKRFDNVYVYNNKIYGALGQHLTSPYFFEVAYTNLYIYNNIAYATSGHPTNGFIAAAGGMNSGNLHIYNNSFHGSSSGTEGGSCIYISGPNKDTYVKNNICINTYIGFVFISAANLRSSNNYYHGNNSPFGVQDTQLSTVSLWQTGARGITIKDITGNFTVVSGTTKVIKNADSSKTATLRKVRSNSYSDGVYRILVTGMTGGEFVDGEAIHDDFGGAAVVDGTPHKYDQLGVDTPSTTNDPLIISEDLNHPNFSLQSSSPARESGVNLTDLGVATLNKDALGNSRPETGGWDIGVYNYVEAPAADVTAPSAPNGLQIQ